MSQTQLDKLSSSPTKISLTAGDYGDVASGAESVDGGEQLSFVPPLAIISTRIKRSLSLARLANPGVAVVHYDYQTTSLARLLQLVGDTLKARKALSIAMVVNGQPGSFQLTQQQRVTLAAVREDQELRIFFTNLVSNFLFTEGEFARIDILNCSVGQSPEGMMMLQALSDLVQVPVFSAQDMWGADVASTEGGEQSVPIGTLFFDGQKLKDWCNQTPQTLDKYEKISIVGQGAYGQAVLYKRKEDESLVILKKINILELNKVERQGVVNEITILSMLMHPHIITYYDHFEEEGSMMIEMEYADGGSLQHFLKQQINPLSELEVLTKFSQMVDALQYIHTHNILHRDLKTANVFLTHQGIVKLGDFGIAKILSATQQAAHTVVGTPYYISPEICEGKFYDAKSDIWSLGCILYEMVCLQRTFEGTNLPALVHKIVEGSFNPVTGKYSEELKQLIKKMLQKDAKARPSAAEIMNKILPPMLRPLQMEKGVFQPIGTQPKLNDTNLRSFLYQLNSHNLLLSPVHWPMKDTVSHVAVGFAHAIAVTTQTSVYSWGQNDYGQLGHGDTVTRSTPTLIDGLKGRNIQRSECGGEFSIFINQNGIVLSCGRGDKGALGHDNYNNCLRPELIKALLSHDAHMMSCGESHIAMITLDQKAFTWGAGAHGRLGTGSQENCSLPKEIVLRSPGTKMVERVRDVHCGLDSTVFITELGRVFACGNNVDNKLGLNRRETFIMQMKRFLSKQQLQVPIALVPTPVKELGKDRIVDCSLGPTHSAFLTESGQVYTYGRNFEGQLGAGNCLHREYPAIVKFPRQDKPIVVMCGELATIVAMENNSFYIWGSRPAVVSPLSTILHNRSETNILEKCAEKQSESVPAAGNCNSPDSGYRDSDNSSPDVKESTSEPKIPPTPASNSTISRPGDKKPVKEPSYPKSGSIGRSLEKLVPSRRSNEALPLNSSPLIQASALRRQSRSDLSIHEIKNTQLLCQSSSTYFQMLLDTLNKSREDQTVKQSSALATSGIGRPRRGSSTTTIDIVHPEGVILHPTPIDLVDKSGILTSLSDQGLEEVKLEGVASFGCNLLVLIHGHLPQTRAKGSIKTQATFTVGRNLRKSTVSIGPLFVLPQHQPANVAPKAIDEVVEGTDISEIKSIMSVDDTMMTGLSDAPTWLGKELASAEVIPAQHLLLDSSNTNSQSSEQSGHLPLHKNDPASVKKGTEVVPHLSKHQTSLESIPHSSSGHTVTSSSERISYDGNRDTTSLDTSSTSEMSQSGLNMLSNIHSTHAYHTNSRSTLQNIHSSGQIPETIKEAELESASMASLQANKEASNNNSKGQPQQTSEQFVTAVPERSQMIQPASSASNLAMRHQNAFNVKKASSTQDMRRNVSAKLRKPIPKPSALNVQKKKSTETRGKIDDKEEVYTKDTKGSTKPSASQSDSKTMSKMHSGQTLHAKYQPGVSPYSQPVRRTSSDGKTPKQKQLKNPKLSNGLTQRKHSNEIRGKETEVEQLSAALDQAQEKIQQAQEKIEELKTVEEQNKQLEERLETLQLRQQELEAQVNEKELKVHHQEEKYLVEIELLKQQMSNDVQALQQQVSQLKEFNTQSISSTTNKKSSAASSRKRWFNRRGPTESAQQESDVKHTTSTICSLM